MKVTYHFLDGSNIVLIDVATMEEVKMNDMLCKALQENKVLWASKGLAINPNNLVWMKVED